MNNAFNALMIVLAAAMISACSTTGGSAPPEIRTGVVEQINLTEVKSTHDQGLGAIIGGVAGRGLGSLIGAGTGRDVAIAAVPLRVRSAATCAEPLLRQAQPAQQFFVRLQSGVLIAITQPVNPAIQRGMRVMSNGTDMKPGVVPA
jgi:outer membrane lipoprotein SlyB